MRRYSGEELGSQPHIVVLGSCKVGNFVASIPTLQGLRHRFPDCVIGFLGSVITADLELALDLIDWRWSWDDDSPMAFSALAQELDQRRARHGSVILAVNLDGFNPVTQVLSSFLAPVFIAGGSLAANRRQAMPLGDLPFQSFLADLDWDSVDFINRYPGVFKSNYIAELFAGLAWVSDYCDPSRIQLPQTPPSFIVPDILIHCTTARAAKIWPFRFWKAVVFELERLGLSVGLIGSPPRRQLTEYNSGDGESWLLSQTSCVDLRGKTTLLELAGACSQAKAVITVDAGPLHIAAAVGTPTLAIVGNDVDGYGASPVRLWMPRAENVERTVSHVTCHGCSEQQFRNNGCLLENHECMLAVRPEQVIAWVQRLFPSRD